MATRSTISIRKPNNDIRTIYCHFDGYIEGNGLTLMRHYSDLNKIERLIELGSLSSLGSKVEPEEGIHDNNTPQKVVTVAYARDMGERLDIHKSYGYPSYEEEYNYVFDEDKGKWYISEYDSIYTPLYDRLVALALNELNMPTEGNMAKFSQLSNKRLGIILKYVLVLGSGKHKARRILDSL